MEKPTGPKKKNTNSKTGNYYKKKTLEWYQDNGYKVDYCEHVQSIFTPRGMIYKKTDLFGADGIAMNGKEIIFWNSKATIHDKNWSIDRIIRNGKEEFSKFPFPESVKRVLVIWTPRQKPQFVDCC